MSRSKKKPIFKDKGHMNDIYNRLFRANSKQRLFDIVNKNHEEVFENINTVVNFYNICDYTLDLKQWDNEIALKASRK